MYYIMHAPICIEDGTYLKQTISVEEMKKWIEGKEFVTAISYPNTAVCASIVMQRQILCNQRVIRMNPDEQALIFRLTKVPPETFSSWQTDDQIKWIKEHLDLSILSRLE